jgi:iron-sulfur cluster repair protein YtfE (RIC family)
MTDKQDNDTKDEQPFQDTLDEHRECMQYIVAVEACLDRRPGDSGRWIGRLLEHLPGLARTMREHFEAEEHGALFTDLPARNPMVHVRLATLKEEHPRLQREVERIIEIIGGLGEPELYELREINARIQLFIARLRRHEATENELIFEAYWDDYGVGD